MHGSTVWSANCIVSAKGGSVICWLRILSSDLETITKCEPQESEMCEMWKVFLFFF